MVNHVGFLEYAWSISFEKDWLKTKLLVSPRFNFPQLVLDEVGLVTIIPEPKVSKNAEEEKTISLMGYVFPSDPLGKTLLVSLFRASVFHLSAHVVSASLRDYEEWRENKDPRLAKFTISLIEDVKAEACVRLLHADGLADLAFANTLALQRLRSIDKMANPATRIMTGLLVKTNTGSTETHSENERKTITDLVGLLREFKEKVVLSSKDGKVSLKEDQERVADKIYGTIEDVGPVTEVPFLPHTEELGSCSIIYPCYTVNPDVTLGDNFKKCLQFLGGTIPSSEGGEELREKKFAAEVAQIFESWERQKEKEEKTLSVYENLLPTKFKSVETPEKDYSEYLRVKARCKGDSHKLTGTLLVATDALDEDPNKLHGVLDLQEVIQVIASKSPRMDVFMLDENKSKSYSWVILLDASRSMKSNKDFALELFVSLGEAANALLSDPTSWGMYAFNDRFFIIKDPKERYNTEVKSRIGGIEFEGSTFMPDALSLAGQVIKPRPENLRLITIISDGWPYGYPDMDAALSETINTLQGGNIALIGIGAQSRRMDFLFKSSCSVYTLRDFTKKFPNLYFEASKIAAET